MFQSRQIWKIVVKTINKRIKINGLPIKITIAVIQMIQIWPVQIVRIRWLWRLETRRIICARQDTRSSWTSLQPILLYLARNKGREIQPARKSWAQARAKSRRCLVWPDWPRWLPQWNKGVANEPKPSIGNLKFATCLIFAKCRPWLSSPPKSHNTCLMKRKYSSCQRVSWIMRDRKLLKVCEHSW